MLVVLVCFSYSSKSLAGAFDGKTWTQTDYQNLQNFYTGLPGSSVDSYAYRPDGTGICLRDDVNGVLTGNLCNDLVSGSWSNYSNYKVLEWDGSNTISDDVLSNWSGNYQGCSGGWGYCYGGYSGGSVPSFNGAVFRWGYGGGIIQQTIAIEQALQAAGLTVDGYVYRWVIKNADVNSNQGGADDPMIVTVNVYDANNVLKETYEYDYTGHYDWTNFDGFEIFNGTYNPSSINIKLEGDDIGYWAGYYGPEVLVNSSYMKMIYRSNPCASNPLYSPDCEGYAEAYAQQQYTLNCTANPLYDMGCPGYEAAYYSQQCSINALYDSGCPGYAEAYYTQQCTLDPLYDSGCDGYETAYFNQQCSLDGLYDESCPNYATAYYNQQCSLNPLYDSGCTGYAEAYYNQQCTLSALYDPGCDGYETAYYNKYIKPELEKQQAQASNTSTDEDDATSTTSTSTSTNELAVADPVESITNVEVTGDVFVDQILRDSADTDTVELSVPEVIPEVPNTTEDVNIDVAVDTNTEEPAEEEMLVAELETTEDEIESENNSKEETETTEENTEETNTTESEENKEEKSETDNDDKTEKEVKKKDSGKSKEEKEKSKEKKIKELMIAKATNLANEMAAVATVEQQEILQRQIMAVMAYVYGFNSYKGDLQGGYYPDANFYDATKLPENQRGLRNGLAQQLLWDKMVDEQYNRK